METKKSKYDTNPLDPDVERKAEEVWGDLGGAAGTPTQQVGGATREVADTPNENARRNVYSEAPTRRYDNPPLEAPYPSVFVPPTYAPPAQQYQQPNQYPYQTPLNTAAPGRTVAGVGIPERWACMLGYVPFIGLIASLIELLLAPRREIKVRFHASQALALHVAILIIQTILSAIASVSDGGGFGSGLFRTASTIFLIISMIRVWRGEPHRIAPLEEPAKWFNQHVEPRNQT
ncbi:MAG TPA: DUF4870 domain-containing protein [Pyrinomonadaceae bacterium]|nr:DUF4870 domain-containing protein [Pyrinomonadaceae bacterium]